MENPDGLKELAHIRALPFCLLQFVYTSGFGKIYWFELYNVKPTGRTRLWALLMTIRRSRDIVDLPDLSGQVNYVGIVADELHRGGLVQAVYDDAEGAIRL